MNMQFIGTNLVGDGFHTLYRTWCFGDQSKWYTEGFRYYFKSTKRNNTCDYWREFDVFQVYDLVRVV